MYTLVSCFTLPISCVFSVLSQLLVHPSHSLLFYNSSYSNLLNFLVSHSEMCTEMCIFNYRMHTRNRELPHAPLTSLRDPALLGRSSPLTCRARTMLLLLLLPAASSTRRRSVLRRTEISKLYLLTLTP